MEIETARQQYFERLGEEVPRNKKNDLDWILDKLDEPKQEVQRKEKKSFASENVRIDLANYESLPESILKRDEFEKMTKEQERDFQRHLEITYPKNPTYQSIFQKMYTMKHLENQDLMIVVIPKDVNAQGKEFWEFVGINDCNFWIRKGVKVKVPERIADAIDSYYNFTPDEKFDELNMRFNTSKNGVSKYDALT